MNRNMLKIIPLYLMFIISAYGQESADAIAAYRNDPYGDARYEKTGIMDGNQIRTLYVNEGEVGNWPNQPSGEWPKGTGHTYLDGVCVLVGAKVAVNFAGIDTFITPMEAAYREWVDTNPVTGEAWGWEPVPGYVNSSSEVPALSNNPKTWPSLWPTAIFTYLDVPQSEWINEVEVNGEPGEDDDNDGYIDNYTYWYGYFGRGKTNAELETFYVMDDSRDGEWKRAPYYYFPIEADSNRGGLGLRVEVRGFQWAHVLAEDNIFWHYDIVNISDTTYNETVFGFLTDVGIGGTDDSGDDNASFDLDLDLAYAYDENGEGLSDFGTWSPTGYLGYAYLESPGNPFNGIDDDNDGLIDERRDDGLDNDNDWDAYTDLNNNGEWDSNEPLNDDLGKDGVGPFDRQYNGPDEGEGDGQPTTGEPDFDKTDKDESDQIGLTSMSIYRLIEGGGGDGWPRHDEGLWRRMTYQSFDTTLQSSNIHMLFGSGPFVLQKDARERFSMALLNGSNLEDLIFNKITVQEIYNANYNFSKPPEKPLLKVVPGDKEVYLFWDNFAEESRDPLLRDSLGNPRKDFEGYLIYRSNEPDFLDIKTITDSKGEGRYWKPIAQYDLINGISGPDPIGINGAHFWRGSDNGLRHSYIDKDVQNGRQYYYALVSYDQGDPDYGTLGLQPTECTKIIREDLAGNVTFIDVNCAVVTPNAPAAGYVPPEIIGNINEVNQGGYGTGSIGIKILNPAQIQQNVTYRVIFQSDSIIPGYETSTYGIHRVENDTTIPVLENIDATVFGDENPSPPVNGFVVAVKNDTTVDVDQGNTGWLIGSSNADITVKKHTRFSSIAEAWPAIYKIIFHEPGSQVDTSFNAKIPVDFQIWNMFDNRTTEFELWDADNSHSLTSGDSITIIEFVGSQYRLTYDITYNSPVGGTLIDPVSGDEFLISTYRPFYEGDYFEFSTTAANIDNNLAKENLNKIKVVPNPYIVGASWEPKRLFGAGRGERKIDFIHLPNKCTIRIFTLSGALVKKIEHESSIIDGSNSWNLVSDDGMDIAYGVYIYHIDAPGIGTHIGKFAVIK